MVLKSIHQVFSQIPSGVKPVKICRLVLYSDFVLDLEKTFYIPNFSENLILVSRLIPLEYSFEFYEICFCLFYKSTFIGMVQCVMIYFKSNYRVMFLIM